MVSGATRTDIAQLHQRSLTGLNSKKVNTTTCTLNTWKEEVVTTWRLEWKLKTPASKVIITRWKKSNSSQQHQNSNLKEQCLKLRIQTRENSSGLSKTKKPISTLQVLRFLSTPPLQNSDPLSKISIEASPVEISLSKDSKWMLMAKTAHALANL